MALSIGNWDTEMKAAKASAQADELRQIRLRQGLIGKREMANTVQRGKNLSGVANIKARSDYSVQGLAGKDAMARTVQEDNTDIGIANKDRKSSDFNAFQDRGIDRERLNQPDWAERTDQQGKSLGWYNKKGPDAPGSSGTAVGNMLQGKSDFLKKPTGPSATTQLMQDSAGPPQPTPVEDNTPTRSFIRKTGSDNSYTNIGVEGPGRNALPTTEAKGITTHSGSSNNQPPTIPAIKPKTNKIKQINATQKVGKPQPWYRDPNAGISQDLPTTAKAIAQRAPGVMKKIMRYSPVGLMARYGPHKAFGSIYDKLKGDSNKNRQALRK